MKQTYDILLVDDEAQTLQLISSILQVGGYRLHTFLNAQDALSFLKFTDKTIHLIIADVNMPYMNGVSFLKRVKLLSKFRTTPFLFLSAIGDRKIQLQAYKEGAIDYIEKPVDIK